MSTERTYQEIVEELDQLADNELVIQTARQDGENHLAVVTVDGVTRGVISRDSMTEALDRSCEQVVVALEETQYCCEDEDDEDEEAEAFDRVVEALESAATLLRRLRR